MDYAQKQIMLKDLYLETDEVEICFLCGNYEYSSEMEKIHGQWVCKTDPCNIEDESTEELVLKSIRRNEALKERMDKVDMEVLAQEFFENIESICSTYKK